MFDIGKILKRAWSILWDYKVLWIFGFLMVLTGAGGSSGGGGGGSTGYRYSGNSNTYNNWNNLPGAASGWFYSMQNWFTKNIGPWFVDEQATLHTITWIIIGIAIFAVVMGLLFALVRYPAETAVMRMVDENEKTGSKIGFKQGWKLGWNMRAFRMWLIDTVLATPGLIIAILVMVGVLVTVNRAAAGTISNVNMAMFGAWVLLAIVLFLPVALLMIVLGMLRQMVVRYAAIDGLGFGESFVKGWELFKKSFKDVLITWLVMVGIGIGIGVAMILVVIVLVPAYAVMAIPGAVVAAIPGAIAFGITTLFSAQVWPWIIGGLVALPIFFMVVFSPLSFVSGWVTIFSSNVWTLAFRQMKTNTAVPPALPVDEVPQG
jgi:nitrogen fixation protein